MKTIRMIGVGVLLVGVLAGLMGCPANHYQQGLSLMEAGLLDDAIAELQQALEQDPQNGEIYYHLGLLYLQKEEYRIALGYFQQVVTQYPQQEILDGASYYLGFCQYYLRDYKAAGRNFSFLLSGFPESPFAERAHFYQAEVAWFAGDVEQALAAYSEVLRRYSAGPYAHFAGFRLGQCHYQLRNYAEAANAYQKFLTVPEADAPDTVEPSTIEEPESVEAVEESPISQELLRQARQEAAFELGMSYASLKENAEAIQAFENVLYDSAIASGRRAEVLYRLGKLLLEEENAQQAIDTWAVLISENPTSEYADDALFLMGGTLYELEKYPTAVEHFSKLVKEYPESQNAEQALLMGGNGLFQLGRYEEAAQEYARLLLQAGDTTEENRQLREAATLGAVMAHYKLEQYRQAYDQLTKIPEDQRSPALLYWNGEISYRLGYWDEAITAFQAVADQTTDPELTRQAYFGLIKVAYTQEQWQTALE
jgi:TolA-binding protein